MVIIGCQIIPGDNYDLFRNVHPCMTPPPHHSVLYAFYFDRSDKFSTSFIFFFWNSGIYKHCTPIQCTVWPHNEFCIKLAFHTDAQAKLVCTFFMQDCISILIFTQLPRLTSINRKILFYNSIHRKCLSYNFMR